nr:MAG TPA: hypothetical protein [Caudoviricetes sp.]
MTIQLKKNRILQKQCTIMKKMIILKIQVL